MTNRTLGLLGMVARLARATGAGAALRATRNVLDAVSMRVGRPPLVAQIDGIRVHGYLRHRSFLDETARPGTTYRGLFVNALLPGMTVVDGGAHVGVYTVLASRGVGTAGRVIAFEPDGYNYRALMYNVRGLSNVRLENKALAERVKRAPFYEGAGTIGSSLVRREHAGEGSVVEVTTIDDELRDVDMSALLVKLNVEGAEPLVLEGMQQTLERQIDTTLFVEVAPALLGPDGAVRLVARLRELGFNVWRVNLPEQSLSPVLPETPLEKGHVFAQRRSWHPSAGLGFPLADHTQT